MRDRRRRDVVTWSRFFCITIFVVFFSVLFSGFTFFSFLLFGDSVRPVLISSWRNQAMEAITDDSATSQNIEIRETVIFPDQLLFFLNCPSPSHLFTVHDLDCTYSPPNSSQLMLPPLNIDTVNPSHQIVRCPSNSGGAVTSLSLKSEGHLPPAPPALQWDSLVYEALIDWDNATIVFVKGLNLRPGRHGVPSRYECVYGWDFKKPKLLLTSDVISAAQEIVRCKTPLSVLSSCWSKSIKVSIRIKGRGRSILQSMARPVYTRELETEDRGKHDMCVCTMIRNQARFIKEWVMYHSRIGVKRWFIYDNNSDDPIDEVIKNLDESGYNITRYIWPWVKTQEAGFAHCALRARESCEWVGFIDVDEYLHFPSQKSLQDIIHNKTIGFDQVGELRISCHSFGPSGLKRVPVQGVSVGYTCRLAAPERHKSIVRPDVLNSSLINVVHHFHIKEGFEYINVDKAELVINHYKYQVWDVFKEKFYRRVATYVVDWMNEKNVGSKDRAPGLGTRAVEPPDWSTRFCEVTDTGLRTQVLRLFTDHYSKRLPWQENDE